MRMALYVIKFYENAAQYLDSYMKMRRIAMISNDITWPNVIKIRIHTRKPSLLGPNFYGGSSEHYTPAILGH